MKYILKKEIFIIFIYALSSLLQKVMKWCTNSISVQLSSFQFSRPVVSDSLRPHESQHARPRRWKSGFLVCKLEWSVMVKIPKSLSLITSSPSGFLSQAHPNPSKLLS